MTFSVSTERLSCSGTASASTDFRSDLTSNSGWRRGDGDSPVRTRPEAARNRGVETWQSLRRARYTKSRARTGVTGGPMISRHGRPAVRVRSRTTGRVGSGRVGSRKWTRVQLCDAPDAPKNGLEMDSRARLTRRPAVRVGSGQERFESGRVGLGHENEIEPVDNYATRPIHQVTGRTSSQLD